MSSAQAPAGADALLSNGEIVHLRPAAPADLGRIRALHARLSARSRYLRYFTAAPPADAYLDRLVAPAGPAHLTLVVEIRGEVVALGSYEWLPDGSDAEVAFLVDDPHQGLGIGTLLLEHLAAAAQAVGIRRFVAETLSANAPMLQVFRDAGFAVHTATREGVVSVDFPVSADDHALAAFDVREGWAEYASLRRLLAPRSVAVVGAGHDPAGLGHAVLANILAGGYGGEVWAVNRSGDSLLGVPAVRSLSDVATPLDLVVVAVPAGEVVGVAREAAAVRARSLVVISDGFAEAGAAGVQRQQELLGVCRDGGLRLVGPNGMGVLSRVDGVSLNATFCPTLPPPGRVGLMSQSGAVGIATLAYAQAVGVGLSGFVSVGNKADVSGNDLLCFWEHDPTTTVCALYLESLGNPRKFARIARRVARRKPVVVVKSGRTVAGSRGVRTHTAAAATPEVAVEALFRQAGVIRAESLTDMLDVVTLLDRAPLPQGNRVAIVGNSGGPEALAADAAEAAGLAVPELDGALRRAFTKALGGVPVTNPLDLHAQADAAALRGAVADLLAAADVDAVLVVYTPIRPGADEEVAAALLEVTRGAAKPVAVVMMGVSEPPQALRGSAGELLAPFYSFPEHAARALGAVARYAAWRREPEGTYPHFADADRDAARDLVAAALAEAPDGCWLPADRAAALMRCYRVPVVDTIPATSAQRAAAIAAGLGWPVVLKAGAGDLVHKTDAGGVAVGLRSRAQVRAAYRAMGERLGTAMGPAVLQPQVAAGVETAIGVVNDESFGPLVMFGLGGVASDLLADRAFGIVPMTRETAAAQVRGLRGSALLFGYRGSAPVDVAGLEDMLLRVAALAEDVPELAELDLNPVIAGPDGAVAVDVKVRLAPARAGFPLLRRLAS